MVLNSAVVAATYACVSAAVGGLQGTSAAGTASANAVFVGGTCIMRVQVATAGFSREQRAAAIQERVNQILGNGTVAPTDVTVEPAGNEATVNVKGKLLFTADWSTARYNHSTPTDLANTWADNMRRVLPSLTEPK